MKRRRRLWFSPASTTSATPSAPVTLPTVSSNTPPPQCFDDYLLARLRASQLRACLCAHRPTAASTLRRYSGTASLHRPTPVYARNLRYTSALKLIYITTHASQRSGSFQLVKYNRHLRHRTQLSMSYILFHKATTDSISAPPTRQLHTPQIKLHTITTTKSMYQQYAGNFSA